MSAVPMSASRNPKPHHAQRIACRGDAAFRHGRPIAGQPRRQFLEAFRHNFQCLQIAAVDADEDLIQRGRRGPGCARRAILARRCRSAQVERLEQHEQAMFGRRIEQLQSIRDRDNILTISSTPPAPAARASSTWYGSTRKSLRMPGTLNGVSAALACRKCSSEPSKREGSVNTETAAAPPCA